MVSLIRGPALWVAAALLCLPMASHADDETPTESFGAGEKQVDGSYIKPAEDGEPEHYLISTPDGTQVIHYPEGKYVVVSTAEDCPNPTFIHREGKECRPDSSGELYFHRLEYLEYLCPKPPKKRRVVIAVVPTDDPCTEGGYYRDRALSEDNFGEKWPRLPEKEVEEKPPEGTGKPPEEKKPPTYSTGKIHNPLATTDCAQKRLWELWFKAFAEGKTPKDAVDIPLVPWSKYTYGADGTGTFESPEGSIVEQRPDGSVWEKRKGGTFKQICPPKTENSGEDGSQPKTTEPPEKPKDEKPKTEQPKEEKPEDDKTGRAPSCEPGALADTLNDLLGTELEGVCEDDTLGNAEGGGEGGDSEGHGGME